jgi:hypothetical protein
MSDTNSGGGNVSAFPLQPREIVGLVQQYIESTKPPPVDPTTAEKQLWDGVVMQFIALGCNAEAAIAGANDVIAARRQQFDDAKEEGDK